MDVSYLFFSMNGRISRARWWLGIIIIWTVWTALLFGLTALLGGDLLTAGLSAEGAMIGIAVLVVLAYPSTALMIKRLNDRERSPWLVLIYWLPMVIGLKLQLFGLLSTAVEVDGAQEPTFTATGWGVWLLSMVVTIWLIIELGLLKGTNGPNSHGPDPLTTS